MPFKHNAARRHRIGKMKFKLTNWAEYEAGLRRRGSLTLWIIAEGISSWRAAKRTTRGGQPCYSDFAIETALTLGLLFGLRLRQTEGFLTSVLRLMGLDLAVPDHTTLSRRARKWQSSGCPVLNRMRASACPKSVRCRAATPYRARPLMELVSSIHSKVRPRPITIPLVPDADLSSLKMPVLIIIGGRDALINSNETRRRAESTMANAQLHYLEQAFHHLPNQRETIFNFLLDKQIGRIP